MNTVTPDEFCVLPYSLRRRQPFSLLFASFGPHLKTLRPRNMAGKASRPSPLNAKVTASDLMVNILNLPFYCGSLVDADR